MFPYSVRKHAFHPVRSDRLSCDVPVMWEVIRDDTGQVVLYSAQAYPVQPLLFASEAIALDFAAALNLGREQRIL